MYLCTQKVWERDSPLPSTKTKNNLVNYYGATCVCTTELWLRYCAINTHTIIIILQSLNERRRKWYLMLPFTLLKLCCALFTMPLITLSTVAPNNCFAIHYFTLDALSCTCIQPMLCYIFFFFEQTCIHFKIYCQWLFSKK